MNLGSQIKKYRNELSMSQDELAEKIFVSRQSISNWENDRTYPDIKSLLLLSEVFQVSLDQLIKGDLEIMRKEIEKQDLVEFERDSTIFTILFIVGLVITFPMAHFFEWLGLLLCAPVWIIALYFGFRMEKYYKKYDVHTFKEISAFMEGKTLDEIEKIRESGKRPYQTVLKLLFGAVSAIVVCGIMDLLIRIL